MKYKFILMILLSSLFFNCYNEDINLLKDKRQEKKNAPPKG
jgi:hypothetical protein